MHMKILLHLDETMTSPDKAKPNPPAAVSFIAVTIGFSISLLKLQQGENK